MPLLSLPKQRQWHDPRNFAALPVIVVLLLALFAAPGRGVDMADMGVWLAAVIPLIIAAIGQTQIVLAGGQGLAAGSTALLVNAIVSSQMAGTLGSSMGWPMAGVLCATAIGACNGILVGFCRLPSTAVTLATSFIVGGVTFELADTFSAPQSGQLHRLFPTDIVAGVPTAFVIFAALLLVAFVLDRSAIGRGIRAAGKGGWEKVDRRAAGWVALSYLIAGIGYGISGVYLVDQMGMADPTSGGLGLVDIYAAVALGGSVPYIRQGSTLGAAFGALAVGGLTYAAAVFGVPDYVASLMVAGFLLIGLFGAGSGIARDAAIEPPATPPARIPAVWIGLPVVLVLLVAIGQAAALFRVDALVILTMTALALAQAGVIITGHLDFSLPAMTAFAGLACVAFSQGSDAALLWIVPLLLMLAAGIGLSNGALGLSLKAPRVLVTLAAAGILNAASLAISTNLPFGFAPPALINFMTTAPNGLSPALLLLIPLVTAGFALFAVPAVRRWCRGLAVAGEPSTSARRAAPLVHCLAAVLAAAMGILLAGYGGRAPISGGDPFILPSLLAIETAGLTVGRRGGAPWLLLLSIPMVLAIEVLILARGMSSSASIIAMGALLLVSIVVRGLGVSTAGAPVRPGNLAGDDRELKP